MDVLGVVWCSELGGLFHLQNLPKPSSQGGGMEVEQHLAITKLHAPVWQVPGVSGVGGEPGRSRCPCSCLTGQAY